MTAVRMISFDVMRPNVRHHGVYVDSADGLKFLPFMSVHLKRPSAEYEGGMEVIVRTDVASRLGIKPVCEAAA